MRLQLPFLLLAALAGHASCIDNRGQHARDLSPPPNGFINREQIREMEKRKKLRNMPKVPAIWTQEFGDCMRDSAIHLDYFQAAYHAHNMTVSFAFEGTTTLKTQAVISKWDFYVV